MAQSSTGPSQIVRRQLWHTNALGRFLHYVPNRLYRDALSPCFPYFVDPAKKPPSINAGRGKPHSYRFSPSPEPEPFERGLPYPSSRRWPSVPPAAEDDPSSMRRLRVFSTHTRAGEPTKRGLVFLSAARDQALAKALAPALQSASCQGERLTSSRL